MKIVQEAPFVADPGILLPVVDMEHIRRHVFLQGYHPYILIQFTGVVPQEHVRIDGQGHLLLRKGEGRLRVVRLKQDFGRELAAAAGLLLIYPGTVSDIIGIIGVGLVVVLNILSARRTKNAEPAV